MASTLTELREVVLRAVGDSSTKSQEWAVVGINQAQLIAALLFNPPELYINAELPLAMATSTVDLSSLTNLRTIELVYNKTAGKRMWPLPWERWWIFNSEADTGSAKFHCRRGSTLNCAPSPEVENLLQVYYWKYPTALVLGPDELDFDHHDGFITATAVAIIWAQREESESADALMKIAQASGLPLKESADLRLQFEEGIQMIKQEVGK